MSKKKNINNNKAFLAEDIKIVISVIALLVSLGSLIFSCRANKLSKQANEISGEALRHSKETYVQMQRPRIILNSRFQNKNIILKFDNVNNKLQFDAVINIKNIGRISAKSITYPQSIIKIELLGKEYAFETPSSNSPPLTLNPEQDYFLKKSIWFTHFNTQQIKQIIEEFNKDKILVKIELVVQYTDTSELNEYTESAVYILRQKEFELIRQSSDERLLQKTPKSPTPRR